MLLTERIKMRKFFWISIGVAFFLLIYACSMTSIKSIRFVHNQDKTLEEVLQQAQKQHKIVFVDVYTNWCGPCKWMEKNTFRDKKVSDFFNRSFVNYKLDGESFEGVNFGIMQQINHYPTYIFMDSEGKVLKKLEGTLTPRTLLKEASDVKKMKTSPE